MCLSPEEMTVDQLQNRVDSMKDYLSQDNLDPYYKNLYEGRLEEFEKLLKEKADAGQMV